MSRFRIVEFTFNHTFEPQIWRAWWPFWVPLYDRMGAGNPNSLGKAQQEIFKYVHPNPTPKCIVHEVKL